MKPQDSPNLALMLAVTALNLSVSEHAIAQPQPTDHPDADADTHLAPHLPDSIVKSTATKDAPTHIARNFAETTDVEWSDQPRQTWEERFAEPFRDAPTALLLEPSSNMVVGTNQLEQTDDTDSHVWQVGGSRVSIGQAETPSGTITVSARPEQPEQLVLSHEDMVLKLVLDAEPVESGTANSTQVLGLRTTDLPRQLTGGSDVTSATGVAIASDGTVWLVGSKLTVNSAGQTTVGEVVTAENLETVAIEYSASH